MRDAWRDRKRIGETGPGDDQDAGAIRRWPEGAISVHLPPKSHRRGDFSQKQWDARKFERVMVMGAGSGPHIIAHPHPEVDLFPIRSRFGQVEVLDRLTAMRPR